MHSKREGVVVVLLDLYMQRLGFRKVAVFKPFGKDYVGNSTDMYTDS